MAAVVETLSFPLAAAAAEALSLTGAVDLWAVALGGIFGADMMEEEKTLTGQKIQI